MTITRDSARLSEDTVLDEYLAAIRNGDSAMVRVLAEIYPWLGVTFVVENAARIMPCTDL